jgi:hypothetical protein
MAKNSFILYHDQKEVIDELSDEDAGKLFKAIYEYNVNKKMDLTGALKLIFIPFRKTFDRNDDKWEDIVKKRSEAGKKGMEKRWKEGKNITNDNKCYQMITNITDSVSVSVSDNVNVSDSVSVSVNNIAPPTDTDTIFNFCFSNFGNYNKNDLEKSCKKFFNYYQERGWKNVNNWQEKLSMWIEDDIESKKIKRSKKRIEVIDGITYEDGIRIL